MSKKKLPWFPCYPDGWMGDTRHMTDPQARVYWDFLCLLYIHEEDGALRAPNKWIAHELHVHINKWLSVRKFLIEDGKLVENPDGSLTNNKAAKVCLERKARSEAMEAVAGEREAQRQEYREQNPRLPFGPEARRKNFHVVPPQASPTPSPPTSPTPSPASSLGGGCQAISLTDQRGSEHNCAPHLHPHTHTNKEEEDSSRTLLRKNEEGKPRKPIPPSIVRALVNQVGQEQADELIEEYHEAGLSAGARNIGPAFRGWLNKQKGIVLRMGGGSASSIGDILATLPKGADGKPDTQLPKRVRV